jgi:AAA15 family ATPase/GTPase
MPTLPDDRRAVPVAAIYGANASGKSNMLDGLRFMQSAVVSSFAHWDAEERIPRRPFRLRPESRLEPSLYVVELIANKIPYTYGFLIDDEEVIEEWLYSFPEKRKRVIFQRKNSDIKFGTTVSVDLKSKLEVLESITRPGALFLSACAQANIAELMPVYRWFRTQLRIRRSNTLWMPRRVAEQVFRLTTTRPEMLSRLMALLVSADVGITDLVVSETEDPYLLQRVSDFDANIEKLMITLENSESEKDVIQQRIDRVREQRSVTVRRAAELKPQLKFVHGVEDEKFDLEDESDGTRSWLSLLPMVLEALDSGYVVAVDEIDTSLHPLLTAQLVGLFHDPEANQNGAQLIFTSHDSSLLGTMIGDEVLHRDEVWFVEKNEQGISSLYPLTDFKPRKDHNAERRYLGGSYGAIPILDSQDFADAARGR